MSKPTVERENVKLIRALETILAAGRKHDSLTLASAFQKAESLLAEIKPPVTVNTEHRLYTIPCGNGYSCLGFDVLMDRHNAVAAWLRSEGRPARDLPAKSLGTLRAYSEYSALKDRAAAYCRRTAKRCPIELTPQLIGLEGRRVEVVDCDGQRRRFQVGKSTGWMPCHLEIARRNSGGGPAVMGAPFQSVRVVA